MRYDIRINNIFYMEIEGYDIQSALEGAGMEVGFTETCRNAGYLDYDYDDVLSILYSDTDRDTDEIIESINETECANITFGPAE